jgi:outer membrane protein TolC
MGSLPSPGHGHVGTSPLPAPPRPASRLPQPQVARHERRLHQRARGVHCLGVADFLTVLDAERMLLAAQDLLADSETLTATALVGVYKALGRGWDIAPERAYAKAP